MHHLLMFIFILLEFVNFIFIVMLLFFERKNPASTWAWLLILIFLPIIGFIIYLLLGQDMSKKKRFNRKILDDNFKNNYLAKLKKENTIPNISSEHNKDIITMNYLNSNSLYTINNTIKPIFDGKELFEDMLFEIKKAEKFIHMQFYIFRSDSTGAPLLDALCERAKAGVEVKLQVDAMGNKISKEYKTKLKESGVRYEVFFPSILGPINLRANYRNHRKFLLIDGNYGYLGGFNIGKEYASEGNLGYWRDSHLKISGDALNEIEERFILDWTYTSKEEIDESVSKYFKNHDNLDTKHKIPTQIISSGPDHEKEHIKNTYMKIMNNAKKTLCIQSPYFIPDAAILESLKLAALSGVEVNVMLPGKPDHFFIPWVANSYIEILLENGVNVYQYQKGFIHAKTVVADSTVGTVGTANMDIRSFALNFETIAIMYSSKMAIELEEKFKLDLKDCTKLDLETFKKRPKKTKFLEAIFRLLSPLM
ncbi:MAG: cardiolipin synthase [Sarcina sp.]